MIHKKNQSLHSIVQLLKNHLKTLSCHKAKTRMPCSLSYHIEQGIIKVGDEVEILGLMQGGPLKTTVIGVEMFKKILDQGQAGDNVGILLRGPKREDIERGQVIAKPGSVKTSKKFEAEIYVLTKDEGG